MLSFSFAIFYFADAVASAGGYFSIAAAYV